MSGNVSARLPIIVLVEPQLGENIGMCARAMLNCGLDRLRLVRPRDGWPNPAAVATAANADEVLVRAEVFASLDEALADCHHVVAATARKRSLAAPVLEAEEAAHQIAGWCGSGAETAVLFGAEASGLDNTSIARADRILTFSTNPDFPSLNLAQSVLLFGWEWCRAAGRSIGETDEDAPVTRGDLAPFLSRLGEALETRGFFLTPDLRPTTEATLRSLFSRATPTERELALLQGVLTALLRRES